MNWNSFSGTLTEETRLNELQFGLITNRDFKYLPTAYCYYGYPQPANPDCWADSNGCAAGNILEEAILQDAMELVERDSIALYPQSTDRLAFHWWQTATVENQPYLIPSADTPKVYRDYSQLGIDNLRDDVIQFQHIVEEKGIGNASFRANPPRYRVEGG